MNEKLFQLLKQTYSSLGLGDSLLKAYAESVAAYATEENIETIVANSKGALEAIQKANDKRAGDAASKAKAEAEQAQKLAQAMYEQQKAELEKQLEELKKAAEHKPEDKPKPEEKPKPEDKPKPEEKAIPDWFSSEQKKLTEQLAAMMDYNKKLNDAFAELKKENDDRKAQIAKEERAKFISSTAKELGVPEWREKEGFSITDAMSNDEIRTYLSDVSNNIRKNVVGANRLGVPNLDKDGKVPQEQVKKIASNLVDKM